MKKFTELCSIDTYQQQQQQLLKKTEEVEVKPKNNEWQELGGGLLMACGEKKAQAFKGWITLQEDTPKGTRIHCNTYEQSMGLSITIAKLNRKI